jgi:hypothetical protein
VGQVVQAVAAHEAVRVQTVAQETKAAIPLPKAIMVVLQTMITQAAAVVQGLLAVQLYPLHWLVLAVAVLLPQYLALP